MTNTSKTIIFCAISIGLVMSGGYTFAYQNPTVTAGPDLYANQGQTIILQGSGYDPQGASLSYYWNCNGGTLSSAIVSQPNYTAPNYSNQNYSCSLTVTNSYSLSSSDNMTVYVNNNTLTVGKQVINLSSGNSGWLPYTSANPGDILSFAITLLPNGQDIHNVIVRDILPVNLIYKGNLMVNAVPNIGGNITSGINVGTVSVNQAVVVSYQAQVASAGGFSYGATTLTNSATVTSTESGTQTARATVVVNRALVYGATTVSTGLTNNFLTDSFFLPMLLIILGLWFYLSGGAYVFADMLKTKIKK